MGWWTVLAAAPRPGGLGNGLDVDQRRRLEYGPRPGTPASRGRLAGLYNAWVWVGYALAPLLAVLVDSITFRPAMLVLSGVTAFGLVAAFLALPETLPAGLRAAGREPLFSRLMVLWDTGRQLLLDFPLLRRGMLLFAMVQFAGDGIVLSSLALLVLQRLGETITLGEAVIGVASLSGGLLALRSVLAGLTGAVSRAPVRWDVSPAGGDCCRVGVGRAQLWPAGAGAGTAGAAGGGDNRGSSRRHAVDRPARVSGGYRP